MKKNYKYTLLSLVLMPCFSQAIGIDSMTKFGKDNKTSFTIINSNKERQFMQVIINKVQVEKDGSLTKIPFNRSNIAEWDLTARPNKTIIDPGLSKPFQLEFKPLTAADSLKDHAYYVSFIPTPTTDTGENPMLSKMAIGFNALAIFPAKEDKALKYRMSFDQSGLKIKNTGETYIRVGINACETSTPASERSKCSSVSYALAGRDLPVRLPAGFENKSSYKVELSSHNYKFEEKFSINKGKTVTSKAS